MKSAIKIVSVIISFAIIISFTACGKQVEKIDASFDDFTLQLFKDLVGSSGLNVAFYVKDKEKYDLQDVPMTWGDAGDEAIRSNETMIKDSMAKLSKFDREKLDERQRLTYDVMVDYFSTASNFLGYEYYVSDFTPIQGIQSNALTNFVEYPFREKNDIENYLTLLSQFGGYMDKLLAFEAERVNKGFGMTDYAIDSAIDQCKKFIEPEENSLIAVFSEKLNESEWLTEQEKSDYIVKNKEVINSIVIPTYEKIAKQLGQYKGKAKNTGGICNYDNGKQLYEYIVKNEVGSEKSVSEIADAIDKSIQAMWIAQMDIISKDPEVVDRYMSYKTNSDPSKAIENLKQQIKKDYPECPDVDVSIKPIYKSVQNDNVLGYWLSPPVDDSTHNVIRYNLSAANENSGATMPTLMAHEGYPGHLYQHAVFNKLSNPHEIRSVMSYTGYTEGWAKYVEEDSYNMIGINDENLITVMQIQENINMAYISRLEIGANYEGWTIEDTTNFLKPITDNKDTVELLYNQAVADACTFLPYYAGKLEMQQLEDNTKAALGDKFDLKEFRETVLRVGPASFSIVDERVQEYIANKLA